MSTPRPFRFAVQSYATDSPEEWRDRARRAEELGYSALHLADHFIGAGEALDAANHPIQNIASVPAMAVAAEATRTLRVGCRVFCIDYREPAILAKEACTLDFFSGGRLELGLGAGWLRSEYEAVGIPFDKPSVRIARLEEMISFLRAFAAEGAIDFQGDHIQASGFEGAPKPVQKPMPPIMIGGGSRRILELAAREADIVSLNFNNRSGMLGPDGVSSGTEEATLEKIGWIRDAAGPRLKTLELEVGAYFTVVTEDGQAAAAAFGKPMGLSAEAVLSSPHALMGTPEEIIETLQARREKMGISYITVPDREMEGFAPVVQALAGQ
ncbi:MAG: TIGR03621 family F420-dependent LLM class oxidoreductase [Myxococcota bacterium]|nr:TIGR03621 family F420-dependent LLM class oxidoreductase [Myxococcota bacterium]